MVGNVTKITGMFGPQHFSPISFAGLKLYPPGTPANAAPTDTKTPVVAENYDEVVFTDPSESFFARMRRLRNTQSVAYSQQDHFPLHSDTDDMATLLQAQEFLQKELTRAKERLTAVDDVLDRPTVICGLWKTSKVVER